MLAHLFSSLLPFENPIGFGASDFIEILLAAILVSLVLAGPGMERVFRALGQRTGWCILLLAVLPVALRLLLLPDHPAPVPGPGLAGHRWVWTLISVAALCSLAYWMLRAWTTPVWALAGGLLTVFEFGPLSEWMNSDPGGALAAAAACLVFGSVRRIRVTGSWLERADWPRLKRPAAVAVLLIVPALFLALRHSQAGYLLRLEYGVRWYRSILLPPMYLAVLAFILSIRKFGDVWLLFTLAIFALGVNFQTNFQLASLAATAPPLLIAGILGLERLSQWCIGVKMVGREAARALILLCAIHFMFWYGVHLFESHDIAAGLTTFETWDSIDRPTVGQRGADSGVSSKPSTKPAPEKRPAKPAPRPSPFEPIPGEH